MANTLADVRQGVAAVFATISDTVPIHRNYVPSSLSGLMVYTDPVRFQQRRREGGQILVDVWTLYHALIAPVQDYEGLADDISDAMEVIINAFDADPTMGGRTPHGCYVRATDGDYRSIGGVECAFVEFVTEAICKKVTPRPF